MEEEIMWSKRVEPDLIRKLYESDARHMHDNDLIDEVGFGLYARAADFIKINRAHYEGIINCPVCEEEIYLDKNIYVCKCGWCKSKKEYHATYKSKQFVGETVVPFAQKFMSDWEKAKDYAEKMVAIDYLIHTFHHELYEDRANTRPAAINFIGGKIESIVGLILELAYGYDKNLYNEQMERWLESAEKSIIKEMVFNKKEQIEKNGLLIE